MINLAATSQSKEKDFNDLEYREQVIFQSKLLYAIKRFPHCYMMAQEIIELAEKYGVFNGTKHGLDELLDGLVRDDLKI